MLPRWQLPPTHARHQFSDRRNRISFADRPKLSGMQSEIHAADYFKCCREPDILPINADLVKIFWLQLRRSIRPFPERSFAPA
jgi:hypothetical protein